MKYQAILYRLMLISSSLITTLPIDSLLIIRVAIFSDFSVYIFGLYNQKDVIVMQLSVIIVKQ